VGHGVCKTLLFLSLNETRANHILEKTIQKNGRSARRRHNRCKNSQLAKTIKKDATPFKWSNVQCWACDGF
jgi:hypothetical protein